jgi:hypothetical protein
MHSNRKNYLSEENCMHDIDRTTREFESTMHEMQPEMFEFEFETNEFENHENNEWEFEAMNHESLHETHETNEAFENEAYEMHEAHESNESSAEALEFELAAEMLEVTNEYELEQFIGRALRRASRLARRGLSSHLGRSLGSILKPLAKAALPKLATLAGTAFGGPLGGMVANRLAGSAGNLFGLELEGLSNEDREFEVARRYVNLVNQATSNALRANPALNPQAIAKAAVATAARQIAPALTTAYPPATAYTNQAPGGSRFRGTWVRRGRRIILYGV